MSERTKLLKKAVLTGVGASSNVDRIKAALNEAMEDLVKVGQDLFNDLELKGKDRTDSAPWYPVSIGSILAVPGIHDALHEASGMVVAVSPIVGGAPIKGPADKLMSGLGIEVSPVGVARYYRDFLDVMVIDEQDANLVNQIEDLGIPAVATNTIMRDNDAKATLARNVLEAAGLELSFIS